MRKSFSKNQCDEALEKQDGKCNSCGTMFFGKNKVRPQYDHIDGDHSNNSTANCQAICSNCHDRKSREENVKRSIEEKGINFVKRCPLCNHKTRWKDYDFSNTPMSERDSKVISNSEYLEQDSMFVCAGCKSTLKVLRADSKAGAKKLSGKKVNEVVKYCTNCSQEYEPMNSNMYIKCEKCKIIFGVWIKEYKKRGFWS